LNDDLSSLGQQQSDEAIEESGAGSGLLRLARKDEGRASATQKTLRSVDDLVGAAFLAPDAPALREVAARYSVAVTPEVAALIDHADAQDPIARQFLPDARELVTRPQELADPIGDEAHSPTPGLVHRYENRVLLKLLTVCPVYCRFCFRRESVGRGKGDLLPRAQMHAALDYVAAHGEISEVILTGGDPLMLSPRRLAEASQRLAQAPHVSRLRVHTRAPTAAPDLVTTERLDALRASGKALHVVLHVNHARELSAAARAAVARLQGAGAMLRAQTVLLAGVNDNADMLEQAMRALVALGVKPYYLHHPDLAPGTGHFRLTLDAGRALYAELARRLGSEALPRYVLDIPGGFGKVTIDDAHVWRAGDGAFRVRDRYGATHLYAET
jgi:lysine 2,3-aminomutase